MESRHVQHDINGQCKNLELEFVMIKKTEIDELDVIDNTPTTNFSYLREPLLLDDVS